MKKRTSTWLLVAGIALILVSLCVVLVIQFQMQVADTDCHAILQKMESLLPERTPGLPGVRSQASMPALEIDGTDYVALLEIPAWEVALPIAARWDDRPSDYIPARFGGSVYGETLALGGTQFDFCGQIDLDTPVFVTDMTGARFAYQVAWVDRSSEAPSKWLMDTQWDLTLFYHDLYAGEYIAVRCEFANT